MMQTAAAAPRVRAAFLLAAALLLAQNAAAYSVSGDICKSGTGLDLFEGSWAAFSPVILTGVLIIFLVAGLAWALAGVANHRGLRVWAKNQMAEGLITILLAAFGLGLVAFMCTIDVRDIGVDCVPETPLFIAPGVFCLGASCFNTDTLWSTATAPSCSPYDVAYYKLQEYRNKQNEGFLYVYAINMLVGAIASVNIDLVLEGVGASISMGSGLSAIITSLQTAMTAMAVSQLLTMAQITLLKVSRLLFVLLFPAGVILRAFGITRGFGGTVLAIALGLFVIYPTLIALLYGMMLTTFSASLADLQSGGTFIFEFTEATPAAACATFLTELGDPALGIAITANVDTNPLDKTCRYDGTRTTETGPQMFTAKQIDDTTWRAYQKAVPPVTWQSLLTSVINLVSDNIVVKLFITGPISSVCGFLGALVLGSILIPFIVFAVMVSFIKALSGLLGEEVDVSNLTRLI